MAELTLGVLNTGYLDQHLVDDHGDYPYMFNQLFGRQATKVTIVSYNMLEQQYPADIDECDAYLITGSKHDAYANDPWVLQLRDFIKILAEQRKKLIGICFGHQLIALALGGSTQKSDKGWGVGRHSYQLITDSLPHWIEEHQTEFSLLVSHQDQVTELPSDATLLASSDFCPHAAYYIEDHILCFQAHPEFKPEFSLALTRSRQHILDNQTYQQGLESAPLANDADLITRWMLNFIK